MMDCWDWTEAFIVMIGLGCIAFAAGIIVGKAFEWMDRAKFDAHMQANKEKDE